MITSKERGAFAEQRALDFLKSKNLTLIEQNYRFDASRYLRGEIDLIMKDQNIYVFVEVRMRLNRDFGSSLDTINRKKQRKLIRSATYYLVEKKLYERVPCRFDAIGIDQQHDIIWVPNAFSA